MALAAWDGTGYANVANLATIVVLADNFAATDHADVSRTTDHALLLDFTRDNADSYEWYLEWSFDATTWFRTTNVSAVGGVTTVSLSHRQAGRGVCVGSGL